MNLKRGYLLMCVLGTVLPYWQFAPWLVQHGLNVRLLLQQLFANRISAFFAVDVLVSALVVLVFAVSERRTLRFWWAPVVAVLAVGVSLALPLLLYLRQAQSYPLAESSVAS